jgi:hypothetical protein
VEDWEETKPEREISRNETRKTGQKRDKAINK